MPRPPLIVISPNRFAAEDRRFYKHKGLEYGERSMAEAVRQAGGLPFLPHAGDADGDALLDLADAVMERADGLLLSGGADVSPHHYGQTLEEEAWRGDDLRDRYEIALYHAALRHRRPVLGVCRGAQLINVAEGGTLWQDIVTRRAYSLLHRCQERYDTLDHEVHFVPDAYIAGFFDGEPLTVNSVHHQAIQHLADDLEVLAYAPDGIVEAYQRPAESWVLGVQWHPEWMQKRASQRRLFERLVTEAIQP